MVCKRKFHTVDEVTSDDKDALEDALALGLFNCSDCKVKFHGMCGKIGQANPTSATVTCPKCHKRIKHPLPFKVKIVKTQKTLDQVGERMQDEQSDL